MARKVIIYLLTVFYATVGFPVKCTADVNIASKVTVKELIVKHSVEMGLDPALALSIAKIESGFCHDKKSHHGAVGVFQLMPSTAKRLGYNPYRVQENIKGGIAYYKMMYKMFGSTELALAAYNAGPGTVKKYKGIPPFFETKKFVSSIMTNYNSLKINPDPAIAQYKNAIKKISNEISNEIEEISNENIEEDYRMQQDAILKAFLSHQGI